MLEIFFFLFLRLKKVELEGINSLINNFNGIFQFFFFLLRLYYLSLKENFKDFFSSILFHFDNNEMSFIKFGKVRIALNNVYVKDFIEYKAFLIIRGNLKIIMQLKIKCLSNNLFNFHY